jgi:glycosyltransferase involved in cell wall biosynthesis
MTAPSPFRLPDSAFIGEQPDLTGRFEMRVALLLNFVAPYRVSLLEALRDRVGELRVFISTPMERERSWQAEWGTLHVVVQKNVSFRTTYKDSFAFSRKLQIHFPYDTLPRLMRYKPEVVVSGEMGLRSLQAAIYKLFHPKVALVIWATLSEHSERGWGKWRTALRRLIMSQADAVLVNGESGARYVARFGIPQHRIHRINQPVDVHLFADEPRQRPEAANTRLLFAGMLTARKGLMPFVDRVAAWARDNPARTIELWWLGDGELRETLAAYDLPCNVSQRFIGHVAYAELPQYYAQSDMLMFPSLMDEWGLVVNEAMAAGLPVLGSIYSQAVEELVEEGRTGWVFDPLSPESISGALDRALSTRPEQLVAMRAAARSRIADLTPANAGARIAAALADLMPQPNLKTGRDTSGSQPLASAS